MDNHPKWYFATNRNALENFFEQIKVAVTSARHNTRLKPICLIDTHDCLHEVADRLAWMLQAGVTLIPHQAELFKLVRQHFGARADIFNAHWLRCDIPILNTEDEFVLYTDIDVMFRRDPDYSEIRPQYVAGAPEHRQEDFSYFNSGVMVMNLPALRGSRERLIDTLLSRLGKIEPHNDQHILNATYTWDRLPNSWNWKPYWGPSDDAVIVHFHGPKPGAAKRMLAGDFTPFREEYSSIFRRNPAGYAAFMPEFDQLLTA